MEFVLLPFNRGSPPIPVPKTLYVCHQRYDGGPFLSYPMRVGKAEAGTAFSDLANYHRSERVNPTPLRDKESFVQTWLYFGFISEFLYANAKDETTGSPELEGSQEIIDQIYGMIVVQDGDNSYVSLNDEKLNRLLSIARPRLPEGREARVKHYEHLLDCIAHAHPILTSLPREFKHTVKYATAGLYELIAQTISYVMSMLGIQLIFGRGWALGYLNQEAKESMMQHGWCPSDIARAETKFLSIQAMHVIRMMDKSLPKRDHSRCSDLACNIYQIDLSNHKVGHENSDCSCGELFVQPHDLEVILLKEDRVPLLRLTGDLHGLEAQLVESDDNTPYIAISHVWADGLGNPHSNSLPRCKLARLRELASMVDNESQANTELPLIWLDTLCCPAKDGKGKQKAIEKIRLVYQRAKHVLVLDAGLMCYESKTQGIHEKVVRIFTSGWVRRLWTLQEGALARSLYFQFADEAVCLSGLRRNFGHHANSIRHRIFAADAMQEFWRIDAFFKSDEHSITGDFPNLMVMDQALQFRSVSVATDEPLCIGTLMSLDLPAILAVEPKEDRMQKVWELLAAKKGGISALVIFLEQPRIRAKGWRWAPRSLLAVEKTIHPSNVRILKWAEGQLGIPTPLGLKVRFPGFKISVSKYKDGKPRHPWPGLKRLPEATMHFRDSDTGEWYMVCDQKRAYVSSKWRTEDDRHEYEKLQLFPLHDIADSDKALIVANAVGRGSGPYEALFGFLVPHSQPDGIEGEDHGLAVETPRHIVVSRIMPENGYIYTTIGKLAMELRGDEMTDTHLELYERLKAEAGDFSETLKAKMLESEEFKASAEGLRERMKVLMAEVMKEDDIFVEAVKTYFGSSSLEDVWALIQDYFNHDFIAERLGDDQIWYVD